MNSFNGYTLLNIPFDQKVSRDQIPHIMEFDQRIQDIMSPSQLTIALAFNEIAESGKRKEYVATSKMIHVAVNTVIFVMWDDNIQKGYGYSKSWGDGFAYVHFLEKMQRLAKEAINQIKATEGLIPFQLDEAA